MGVVPNCGLLQGNQFSMRSTTTRPIQSRGADAELALPAKSSVMLVQIPEEAAPSRYT